MQSYSRLLILTLALTSVPAAAQRVSPWKEYRSEKLGYSVQLPGSPRESKRPAKLADGRPYQVVDISLKTDGGLVEYRVVCFDFPAESLRGVDPNVVLDGGRDSGVQLVMGRLAREKPLALGKNVGREFVVETNEGTTYNNRAYVVGDRLFLLQAATPRDRATSRDLPRFLDSFQLIAKPDPAPPAAP